jgi:hypothetical protein
MICTTLFFFTRQQDEDGSYGCGLIAFDGRFYCDDDDWRVI